MKLTREQVQADIDTLPVNYKTKDIDAIIKKYIKAKADASALREYILKEQQFYRVYFYVTLKQIKDVDKRLAFIHDNLLFEDWWHTDGLIKFVDDLDFEKAYTYGAEYVKSAP